VAGRTGSAGEAGRVRMLAQQALGEAHRQIEFAYALCALQQ
jgi:hypothetical protein